MNGSNSNNGVANGSSNGHSCSKGEDDMAPGSSSSQEGSSAKPDDNQVQIYSTFILDIRFT